MRCAKTLNAALFLGKGMQVLYAHDEQAAMHLMQLLYADQQSFDLIGELDDFGTDDPWESESK